MPYIHIYIYINRIQLFNNLTEKGLISVFLERKVCRRKSTSAPVITLSAVIFYGDARRL